MTSNLTRRTGALVLLAAAAATVLSGCGGVGVTLTYQDTEKVKVTDIVLTGRSGDVSVTTAAIAETRITRVVHRRTDPEPSYRIEGTVLHLDTDCGPDCTASYQVEAPAGVKVRGKLQSGDIALAGVGASDVTVTSGDVVVDGATGSVKVKTTSGDITVRDATAGASLAATSGDLRAIDVGGSPVSAKTTSGDVTVRTTAVGSVTAQATSGDVSVLVPDGAYRVNTSLKSGDAQVVGIRHDPAATNVIDVRTHSGDVTVATAPSS
jgi:hypothetical protein